MPSAIGGLLGGMAVGKERDEQRKRNALDDKLAQGRYDLQVSEQDRINRDSLLNRRDTLLQAMPNLDPSTVTPWTESVATYNKIAPPDLQISTDLLRGNQTPAAPAVPGLSGSSPAVSAPAAAGPVPGLSGVTGNHPVPMEGAPANRQPTTPPSAVGAAPPPKILTPRAHGSGAQAAPAAAGPAPGGDLTFGSPAAEAKWWGDKATAAAQRAAVDAVNLAISDGKGVMLEATTTLGKKFGSYAAALQSPPTKFNATMTEYIQGKMAEGWSYDALLESGLQRVYDDYAGTSKYLADMAAQRGKNAGDSLEWAKEVRANQDDFVETLILMTGGNFERGIDGLTANMNTDQAEIFNRLYGEGISAVASGVNGRLQAAALLRQFGGQAGVPIDTELAPWAPPTMDTLLRLGPMDLGGGNSTYILEGQLYAHIDGQDFLVTPKNVDQVRAKASRKGGVAGVPLRGKTAPVPEMLRPPEKPFRLPEGVRR